jgi:hypothetical protein
MMPAIIEFVHSLFIILFMFSVPFLFIRKWKKLRVGAAIYGAIFILVNRLSHYILGECIFTRMARWVGGDWDNEWFSVKFARTVFGFIPSNRHVSYVEQILLLMVCLAILYSVCKKDK